MNNLYIYVEGSDLAETCTILEEEFLAFLQVWKVPESNFINYQSPRTSDLLPEDYPQWDLGINVKFDILPSEKLEQLIKFLNSLSSKTKREFVIGYHDPERGISEDWCFIDEKYNEKSVAFLQKLYCG